MVHTRTYGAVSAVATSVHGSSAARCRARRFSQRCSTRRLDPPCAPSGAEMHTVRRFPIRCLARPPPARTGHHITADTDHRCRRAPPACVSSPYSSLSVPGLPRLRTVAFLIPGDPVYTDETRPVIGRRVAARGLRRLGHRLGSPRPHPPTSRPPWHLRPSTPAPAPWSNRLRPRDSTNTASGRPDSSGLRLGQITTGCLGS
jgi:hypothetical protein